jgi:hypothetical protein
MDTKNFFSKIREIIREEIEYALEKKAKTESSKKKVQQEALQHGVSLFKNQSSTPKPTKQKQVRSEFSSIQDLLAETRRSLQESMEDDNYENSDSYLNEGYSQKSMGAIPQGVDPSEVPSEVMSALTRDYSALMKKIQEKNGG